MRELNDAWFQHRLEIVQTVLVFGICKRMPLRGKCYLVIGNISGQLVEIQLSNNLRSLSRDLRLEFMEDELSQACQGFIADLQMSD